MKLQSISTRLDARHAVVGALAVAVFGLFWYSRMDWSEEHRLWRATGDTAFILLTLALLSGALSRLSSQFRMLLVFRREIGIWCALTSIMHGFVVLSGWVKWDINTLLGFQFVPQLQRFSRLEEGFGLANLIGILSAFILSVLAATSADRVLNALGPSSWKWLQQGAYTVFYLIALHAVYFLFMHFTLTFHTSRAPDPNWFRWPFVGITVGTLAVQAAAFLKTVADRRRDTRTIAPAKLVVSGSQPAYIGPKQKANRTSRRARRKA